jgi:hypothetical protein
MLVCGSSLSKSCALWLSHFLSILFFLHFCKHNHFLNFQITHWFFACRCLHIRLCHQRTQLLLKLSGFNFLFQFKCFTPLCLISLPKTLGSKSEKKWPKWLPDLIPELGGKPSASHHWEGQLWDFQKCPCSCWENVLVSLWLKGIGTRQVFALNPLSWSCLPFIPLCIQCTALT